MRLLISIIKFEQKWGGAPESVRLLARSLAPAGIDCDVVTNRGFRTDVANFEFLPAPGTETEQLLMERVGDYDAFLIAGPWQPYLRLGRILSRLSSTAKIIYLPRGGLAMAEFKRPRDIKKFPYLAMLERRLLARSDHIVFSSRIEDERTRLIGPQTGKRIVIPDLVETVPLIPGAPLRSVDGRFTATFLAEAAPRKGLLRMLRGLGIAIGKGWVPADIVLNIGGSVRPGSERYMAACRAAAAALPIETRFLGSVAHDDRAALYAATDLFVTPSAFESFGLTVIEALSAGCRLLTTPDLGSLEFLPRSNAVTIADSASVQDLARGFRTALAGGPKRIDPNEAAITREMCQTAIDAINMRAQTQWQDLLAASPSRSSFISGLAS